jgi:hypothetical protein
MEGIEEAPEVRTSDALKGAAMPKPNPEGVVEAQPMLALEPTRAIDEAPTLVATKMVEQEIKTTPPHKAGIEDEDEKNVASCGTLVVRSKLDEDDGWQPPKVTHDFTYPSDEEIVPNWCLVDEGASSSSSSIPGNGARKTA